MQPYFFPYIGYFQLMHAADVFVIYDDAQYMKGGWVNRNRIKVGAGIGWLTMPVLGGKREMPINRREYALSGREAAQYVERRLQASYAQASFVAEASAQVRAVLNGTEANVAAFNAHLLVGLAQWLGVRCRFETASRIGNPEGLGGQARVIDLCQRVGASHYVNPVGGTHLYQREAFEAVGLKLSYLQTCAEPAVVAGGTQHLSILDGLLCEGSAGCWKRLDDYVLRDPS